MVVHVLVCACTYEDRKTPNLLTLRAEAYSPILSFSWFCICFSIKPCGDTACFSRLVFPLGFVITESLGLSSPKQLGTCFISVKWRVPGTSVLSATLLMSLAEAQAPMSAGPVPRPLCVYQCITLIGMFCKIWHNVKAELL